MQMTVSVIFGLCMGSVFAYLARQKEWFFLTLAIIAFCLFFVRASL